MIYTVRRKLEADEWIVRDPFTNAQYQDAAELYTTTKHGMRLINKRNVYEQ